MSGAPDDPIASDEILFRRIPVSQQWYNPHRGLSPKAFRPHVERDRDGISLSRSNFHRDTAAFAAQGPSKKGYYVALLRAGDLLEHGIRVVADRTVDDPGHCRLPDINSGNRDEDECRERQLLLAERLW